MQLSCFGVDRPKGNLSVTVLAVRTPDSFSSHEHPAADSFGRLSLWNAQKRSKRPPQTFKGVAIEACLLWLCKARIKAAIDA